MNVLIALKTKQVRLKSSHLLMWTNPAIHRKKDQHQFQIPLCMHCSVLRRMAEGQVRYFF